MSPVRTVAANSRLRRSILVLHAAARAAVRLQPTVLRGSAGRTGTRLRSPFLLLETDVVAATLHRQCCDRQAAPTVLVAAALCLHRACRTTGNTRCWTAILQKSSAAVTGLSAPLRHLVLSELWRKGYPSTIPYHGCTPVLTPTMGVPQYSPLLCACG